MEIVGVCGDHLAMWQDYAQSQLSQGELGLIEVKTMGVNDFNGVGNSIYFSWFLRVREGFRGWSMDLQDYQYNEGFGVLFTWILELVNQVADWLATTVASLVVNSFVGHFLTL